MDSRTAAFGRKRSLDEIDGEDGNRLTKKANLAAAEENAGLAPTINWNAGAKSKIRTTLGGSRPKLVNSNPSAVADGLAKQGTTTIPFVISDDEDSDGEDNVVLNLKRQIVNNSEEAEPLAAGIMELKDASKDDEPRTDDFSHSESQEDGEVSSGDAMDLIIKDRNGMDSTAPDKDAMMDYSTSGVEVPTTQNKESESSIVEQSLPRTLADLDVVQLKEQLRYFYIGRDPCYIDLNEPVKCLVCAKEGHTILTCPALVCQSCQMVKDHFTRDCPRTRKCQKCRNRGHDRRSCPYKLPNLDISELRCELCQQTGHAEADCELIWRTSGRPWESDLRSQGTTLSCYECGKAGHLGNACPTRNPRKPLGSSSWGQSDRQSYPSKNGITIKGRAQQRDLQDRDSDEDRNNFIRPRIPLPSRKGQIRVAGRNAISSPSTRSPPKPGRGSAGDQWGAPTQHEESRNNVGGSRRYAPEPVSLDRDYRIHSRSEAYESYQPPIQTQQPHQRRDGGKNGASGPSYRPMPSAAERAWKRHRS